jgi:hypothetical protein
MVGLHDRRDTIADDQVGAQMVGAGSGLPRGRRCLAQLVIQGPRHIEKDPIAFGADQQRDVLVGAVAADAEGVDGPRRKRLAATIECPKVLAETKERLFRFEPDGQPTQATRVAGRKVVKAAADVAIIWLVGKADRACRVLET